MLMKSLNSAPRKQFQRSKFPFMEEWKEYKLADVCSRLRSGKGIKSDSVLDSGPYPVIGGNGIRGYANESNFKGECAVIGRQGAYCGNVRFYDGEAYMTEHAVVVVGNELADTRFLACLLSLMHLGNLSAQSAQPGISVQTLSKLIVNLPSIDYQKRVSAVIKSLDDKIEVNRRINENLEQQAQALFKSWFVDFEPFKDQPFVESELGLIPQGWRVFELGEIARLCAGGDKPLLISKTISDACKVPIYSNGLDDEGLYGYTDEDRIKEKSITVSARGTIGDVNLRLEPYCPIVRLISVIPNNQDNLLYIYYALRNKKIEGVGTTQQQLTVPNFKKEKILLPDKAIIFSFSECLSPIINYKNHIKKESRRLAELRDTLLPRLMSGELKVSDVDA